METKQARVPAQQNAPVFVDSTGRRRRLIRRAAIGLLGLVCAYGVLVVLSFLGGPPAPGEVLPMPGRPAAAPGAGGASSAAGGTSAATTGHPPTSSAARTGQPTDSPSTLAPRGTVAAAPAPPAPTGSPSAGAPGHRPTTPPAKSPGNGPSATGHGH